MKRAIQAIFLLAVALSVFSACRRYASIHGNVGNLPDGMVYLMRYDGGAEIIDSAHVNGGRFTIRQPGPLPDIYFFRFGEGIYVPVAVEGSELYVTGDFDLIYTIRVTGSPGNEALEALLSTMRPYEIMLRTLRLELQEMPPAGPDSLTYRNLALKQDSIRQLIRGVRSDFIKHYPDNLVSAFLVASILADSTAARSDINALADELDPKMMPSMPLERIRKWQEMQP